MPACPTGSDGEDIKLQTQVKVLQTDSLAWEVIKRLRLDQQPEMAHRKFVIGPMQCLSRPDQSIDSVSPTCKNQLEDQFRRRLRVQSPASDADHRDPLCLQIKGDGGKGCEHDGRRVRGDELPNQIPGSAARVRSGFPANWQK